MPSPPLPYNIPHFTLQPGESVDPGTALLALADLLATVWAPRAGGRVNLESPEQLSGAWPEIVLQPVRVHPRSFTTQGSNGLPSHPGGTRYHDLTVRLFAAVGPRTQTSAVLWARGGRLVLDLDRVLADNRTLGGQVHLLGSLADPEWKPYRFGDLIAQGWEWMLMIQLLYTEEAG